MSSTGEIPYQSGNPSGNPLPVPQPIYSGDEIENPTAVVALKIDKQNHYYLLSIGELSTRPRAAIHSFTDTPGNITTVIDQSTTPTLSAIHPVDIPLLRHQEDLLF